MAGKKINEVPRVTDKNLVGQHLIPVATGDGEAHAITADDLFNYLEQNLGLTSIPLFDTEKEYKAPDLVKYRGLLYQFTSLKSPGPWDQTKAQQTSVFAQLMTLRMGDDEQVTVTIGSSDGMLPIEGLDVLLEYDDISVLQQTDAQGSTMFTIPKGKVYTLAVSEQNGYYPLSQQTYKAAVDNRYASFIFAKTLTGTETVKILPLAETSDGSGLPTPFIGKTITCNIDGGETLTSVIADNGWATFELPLGTRYTLVFPHVSGYSEPAPMSFTAELTNRVVIPNWSWYVGDDEVLIACEDGREYTYDAYNALEVKPTPMAIHVAPALLTSQPSGVDGVSGCDFYLPFANEWENKQFCDANKLFESIPQISSSTSGDDKDCHNHFQGLANTQRILAEAQSKSLSVAACSYCAGNTLKVNAIDKSGNIVQLTKQGFLGEFGQLWAIKTALSIINACRVLRGLTNMNINSGTWWSSTQYTANTMWTMVNGSSINTKASSTITLPLYA